MAGNLTEASGSPPGRSTLMGGDFITHNFQAGLSWSFF
jgi:hypothetical protein